MVLYIVEELGLSVSWSILSLLDSMLCHGNESLCSWKVLRVCVRGRNWRYCDILRCITLLNPTYKVGLCSYFSYKVICLCSSGLLRGEVCNVLTSSWYCAALWTGQMNLMSLRTINPSQMESPWQKGLRPFRGLCARSVKLVTCDRSLNYSLRFLILQHT